MLVSIARSGPLRHRILKGFVVAAADPAAAVEAVRFNAGDLAGLRLVTSERAPGVLWLDTGMVWLSDPDARTDLRQRLAAGAVALAAVVRAAGGRLVPAAWSGAGAGGTWLCADLHAVETVTDTQRELCTNLLRLWVPELVALTGRAAFGGTRIERHGSRRLADAGDHLATRYLASAGATHLSRVRDSLRRDEGVSRLELMDVNPVGLADPVPNVVLRCVDAQILPATVVADAVLVQAMAIRARQMERDGRRVPAGEQRLLDRNRSRAVSGGLSAVMDTTEPGADRRRAAVRTVSARDRVLRMIDELTPQLQAMRVQADELAPLTLGLTVAGSHPGAVRSETDLLGRWAAAGTDLDRADFYADAAWLTQDHITAANTGAHPGATAVARAYWADRLAPRRTAPQRPAGTGPGRRPARAGATGRDSSTRELFTALAADGLSAADVTKILAGYLTGGGDPDLLPALRGLPAERARTLRRLLRPARALTREIAEMPADLRPDGDAGVTRLARRDGRALLTVKIPGERRADAVAGARRHLAEPPAGLGVLLLTNAVYQDQDGGRRGTVELLLVRTDREGAR
ncbi:hypothetical protein [Actinoplanes sp. N902-109]|uniref:hypothetical protein n=1 Tax=Actinoplanes sp. (strain N902-109) TaxID=649831 RepID=UPI0003293586|nr:hypothetical protein [Actinoplanes sp. N902-109]AGL18920.1 hypothetical protein L083_5410 [Actinoplanes sp. N902-109]